MSVVVETTLGDITVDLFTKERPRACQNFLKLCKTKYYNFNLFHTVSRGFIAQTGDPTGTRNGGESIFGVNEGPMKRFFASETNPVIKHTIMGLISFVGNEENMIGSQFFFTLGDELTYLDGKHCVFGQVVEGLDVLELINEAICDSDDRPYQDIRITHTVILDDPLPDLKKMFIPSRSPSPSAERLQGGRIAPDEEIDETIGKSIDEVHEMAADREAKARATILEMVGDLPDADMAPPENVLFVCKLNPVTTEDDLEIIFSRFGKIKSCEVIRDHKSGDSLQYAFIEFEDQKSCEDAYFKMDNVLIDDRRIHVDFSQSVAKVKWMGKGRGVKHFNEEENDEKKKIRQKKEGSTNRSYRNSCSPSSNRNYRNSRSPSSNRDRRNERSTYNNRMFANDKYKNERKRSKDRNKHLNFRERQKKSRSKSPQRRQHRNHRQDKSYKSESRRKTRTADSDSSEVEMNERKRYNENSDRERKNSPRRASNKSRLLTRNVSPENKSTRKKSSKTRQDRSVSDERREHRKKSYERSKERSDGNRHKLSQEKSKSRQTSTSESSSSDDERTQKKKKSNERNRDRTEGNRQKITKKGHKSRRSTSESSSSCNDKRFKEKKIKISKKRSDSSSNSSSSPVRSKKGKYRSGSSSPKRKK